MTEKTPEQIVDQRFPKAGEHLRASLIALAEDAAKLGRDQQNAAEDEALVHAVADSGRWSMSPDVVYAGWWPNEQDFEHARAFLESLRSHGYQVNRIEMDRWIALGRT